MSNLIYAVDPIIEIQYWANEKLNIVPLSILIGEKKSCLSACSVLA